MGKKYILEDKISEGIKNQMYNYCKEKGFDFNTFMNSKLVLKDRSKVKIFKLKQ